MIFHYIKYAFRNFRNKLSVSLGSVLTLLLGTVCISLLFTYVYNELSMDKFHSRGKDIYAIVNRANEGSEWTPIGASSFFNFDYRNYPSIEKATSIRKYREEEIKLIYEGRTYMPEGIVSDSLFFDVFDFEVKRGEGKEAMRSEDGILITEKLSQQMFGHQDPIGQVIKVDVRGEMEYTIKGILANPPSNSSIAFDFVLPQHKDPNVFSRSETDYILTKSGFDEGAFKAIIKDIGKEHHQFKDSESSIKPFLGLYYSTEISDKWTTGVSKKGDRSQVYVLVIMIGVILLISVLNFSNLQVIETNVSIKQAATNLIYGAEGRHLVYQKLVNIMILIVIAFSLAIGAYHLVLPFFNALTGAGLLPSLGQIILINGVVLLLMGALAIVYPMTILLRMSLTKSLKGQFDGGRFLLSKRLVIVVQFSLTFILLISAFMVSRQLNFMLDKDLGIESQNILRTKLFNEMPRFKGNREEMVRKYEEVKEKFQYVKNEIVSHSAVASFSQGGTILEPSSMDWKTEKAGREFSTVNMLAVGPGYEDVFGLELSEGRFFDNEKDKERSKKVVINEMAKKYWQIDDIATTTLESSSWGGEYRILGVVKDFNYQHLSAKPEPLIMLYFEDFERDFMLKFHNGAEQEGLAFVKGLFDELNPGQTFHYRFFEDEIQALYQKEKQLSTIFILFTLVALLISCIGLFAIALDDTQKRVKEIGVRKVNGATVREIIVLLNADFVRWVLVAFAIACPVSYYFMSKWLESFAYKTTLDWWIFGLAGLLTLCVALLTISGLSYRAAITNPVNVLKDE
ncbi:FtsX-like permease family protein [Echinicola soli]|uniref:FtsX-like permease family protein n=1 Tax=Echinicola soli TaxID=2591634 RepID=A0A514CNA1_9BACT|nr:ABC transporter permease [Echinicola soli]QDH81281.1 FtsX-like permease family protein [Echinicola soli]